MDWLPFVPFDEPRIQWVDNPSHDFDIETRSLRFRNLCFWALNQSLYQGAQGREEEVVVQRVWVDWAVRGKSFGLSWEAFFPIFLPHQCFLETFLPFLLWDRRQTRLCVLYPFVLIDLLVCLFYWESAGQEILSHVILSQSSLPGFFLRLWRWSGKAIADTEGSPQVHYLNHDTRTIGCLLYE